MLATFSEDLQLCMKAGRMSETEPGAHTIKTHGAKVAKKHMHDWLILLLLVVIDFLESLITQVIDKAFGFDTSIEEAQCAINAAHIESDSIENAIGLVKLMGRYSGYIAMYATLASRDVDCCLIPELPFYLEGPGRLFDYIEKRLKENGHVIILIAKGTKDLRRDSRLKLLTMVEGQTEEVIFDHLHATAFQYTPLGRTILGPAQNIKTITKEDLKNYISTHYTASRMVIAASGAVKHEDIVGQVKKLFTKLSIDPTVASELVAKEPAIFTGSKVGIVDDDMPLAQFSVAFNGASWTDPDSIALMVMQSMLGSWNKNAGGGKHMGSELAQRVVINEIAESMLAFNTNCKDTGLFGVYAIAKSLEGSIPLQHDAVVRLYIYQGRKRFLPDYKLQQGPSSESLLFSSSKQRPHCNFNQESISINGQTLGIDSSVFATSSNKGTIFDSGTTLAYIAEEAFDPFVNDVNHDRPID
ncbi:hypothetical protein RHMOL_Rhmol04G0293900 [Rhododendron molle]|uniref:Uncharacterized protein n=1 Tax=Rhododendron molle TaxID=49168 RepID=A0ACC0P6U3_RHOML|nr:hypothetical protein RHMOL_Rhmol04G0293900 [Rhododendron molle]